MEELPPFPTLGVKFSVFLKFIEDNGGKDAFIKKPFVKEPLTTTDVCSFVDNDGIDRAVQLSTKFAKCREITV